MEMLNLLTLGILDSMVATTIMTLYEIPFWRKWDLTGVFEWHENQILSIRFFGTSRRVVQCRGIFFLHFLNGTLGRPPLSFCRNLLGKSTFNDVSYLIRDSLWVASVDYYTCSHS